MHGQAMIHGDLKGVRLQMLAAVLPPNILFIIIKANILIDKDHHARLADFGLLIITSNSNSTNFAPSSSHMSSGTTRWMSPEILDPDMFGLTDSRPTQESDCYALGMVVLEVLSGRPPFTPDKDFVVMRKVIDGERPGRPKGPEGAWFTDDLWQTLERCWAAQSESRPSVKVVLDCLGRVTGTWKPPSQKVGEDVGTNPDDLDYSVVSDYCMVHCPQYYPLVLTAPPAPTRTHSIRPLTTDRPSGGDPRKEATVLEGLLTIPLRCSFDHLDEIITGGEAHWLKPIVGGARGWSEALTLTQGQRGIHVLEESRVYYGVRNQLEFPSPFISKGLVHEPQQREDAIKKGKGSRLVFDQSG